MDVIKVAISENVCSVITPGTIGPVIGDDMGGWDPKTDPTSKIECDPWLRWGHDIKAEKFVVEGWRDKDPQNPKWPTGGGGKAEGPNDGNIGGGSSNVQAEGRRIKKDPADPGTLIGGRENEDPTETIDGPPDAKIRTGACAVSPGGWDASGTESLDKVLFGTSAPTSWVSGVWDKIPGGGSYGGDHDSKDPWVIRCDTSGLVITDDIKPSLAPKNADGSTWFDGNGESIILKVEGRRGRGPAKKASTEWLDGEGGYIDGGDHDISGDLGLGPVSPGPGYVDGIGFGRQEDWFGPSTGPDQFRTVEGDGIGRFLPGPVLPLQQQTVTFI